MRVRLAIAASAVLLMLPGRVQAAAPAKAGGDPEVARLGTRSIRKSDLVEAYLFISPENRPDLSTLEAKETFVQNLVNKELMLEEARREGLDKEAGYVEERGRRTGSFLVEALQEQLTNKLPTPEDEDVARLAAQLPFRYHFYQIYTAEKAKADHAVTRLNAGEPWAVVERDVREDPEIEFEEGDTQAIESLPFELRDALLALSPGKWSPVVPMKEEYHVLYLESREAAPRDSAKCLEVAKSTLQKDIWRKALDAFDADVEARTHYRRDDTVMHMVARRFRESAGKDEVPGKNLEHWPVFAESLLAVPLATWDGGSLRLDRFLSRLSEYPTDARPNLGNEHDLRTVIRIITTDDLHLAEAKRLKLDSRPEVARRFRRANERSLVRQVYARLTDSVAVPEDSVRAYYGAHSSEMSLPAEYHAYVVVLADSSAADSVYHLLGAAAEIGPLARKLSIHKASAAKDGDLGWIQATSYPELYPILLRTQPHAIALPVRALGGWAIVRVEETRGTRVPTYEEARASVSALLTGEAQDRKLAAWLAVKSKGYVRLFPDRLKEITIP